MVRKGRSDPRVLVGLRGEPGQPDQPGLKDQQVQRGRPVRLAHKVRQERQVRQARRDRLQQVVVMITATDLWIAATVPSLTLKRG